ncbi:hypothetical protein ENUP19_0296G0021 [Entamoeba nuttalli]|uniref:Cell division control protein 45 CDC45, putative n=2 Tax=Entamoeba nuttalli TaxID=412467 RepID=K2GGA6_ENTNP|nr:cell division control protein 45 CDC45, putative [Entamoeba nuttalli P19]EKE41756.1 cell division control protein 45 CDC45, putative [Entamoeba nuttalli P19]|eukprot:XP_008855903.1 cell division control protein 45 CDC45, putative [Entamoeba nuttalli P19]
MIINGTSFEELYNGLRNRGKDKKTIQLYVSPTVDAIVCYKILSMMFEKDGLLHSAVPVNNYETLSRVFKETIGHTDVHTVFFIDCAGSIDVSELLGDIENIFVYIIDSHRPFNKLNVTSTNIGLITSNEYKQFTEQETQLEKSDLLEVDDDLIGLNKSQSLNNCEYIRKMVDSDGEFYSESVGRVALGIAKKLNKVENDMYWYAAIGVCDQYISLKINAKTYVHAIQYFIDNLQLETLEITDLLQTVKTPMCVKMDCQLMLLRHWTLYDSLFHTREIASKLGIWTSRGKEKFDVLIADMGIPLSQAQQSYKTMSLEMKNKFLLKMEGYSKFYHFENLFLPSFFKKFGMDYSISAFDAAHAIGSIITNDEPDQNWQQQFWEGFKLLSSTTAEPYDFGFTKCIESNKNLVETGIILLLSGSCFNEANKYRFCSVSDALLSIRFKTPYKALQLAQFLAEASSRRYKKWLPFILAVLDAEKKTFVIVGYSSPISVKTLNYFGAKFTQTAQNMKISILQKSFDSFVTEIHRENLVKYKKALHKCFTSI